MTAKQARDAYAEVLYACLCLALHKERFSVAGLDELLDRHARIMADFARAGDAQLLRDFQEIAAVVRQAALRRN